MSSSTLKTVVKAFAFWVIFELGMLSLTVVPEGLPNWIIGFVFGSLVTIFACLLTWLFLKSDELTLAELGMRFQRGSLARFFVSLLAGMAVVVLILLINVTFVPLTLELHPGFTVLKGIVLSCLTFITLSVMEEVAFRGYFLKKLQGALGVRAAIYITSICFGLYHGLNVESAIGPATWGLTFGVLALWSRGLAVPIGFHAGLNYVPALLGEKLRYADPVWTLSVADESGVATLQTIAGVLQLVVLVTGVMLVEIYIRRQKNVHGR